MTSHPCFRPSRAAFPLMLATLLGGSSRGADRPPEINFGRDVLPILSDNCFRCHGPDVNARKAGLRLDTQDGALRKTDPVIVPGNSADSELVRRITNKDPDKRMPPPTSGRTLTPRQI